MDDITASYDMQTGGISWVWCMDDITASYDMQTCGVSVAWQNGHMAQEDDIMASRDV